MITSKDGGRMPRLDHSIDIKAPRDKVFEYISDVEAHPEWVKWARSAEVTSPAREGLGATDVMVMQVGPRKETVEAIVTEYKPGQLFTRRHTRGMAMTDRKAVVTLGDMTKVAWSVEYTPPMGMLGKAIDLAFMVRLFDQLMEDSLEILKERLETAK
jgi:uncharacterized membrane protein